MRKLYLHIGHGKTGSSFLQSSFANSVAAMNAHGLDYPAGPTQSSGAAEEWRISSGNGGVLLNAPPDQIPVARDRVFFSSEGLFQRLVADPETARKLTAFCDHHDVGAVRILMFLRDPIPHAESAYQQMVKRGGATYDVDHAFETYTTPDLARRVMRIQLGDRPIEWSVYNYDRNRARLLRIAEQFLDLPEGALTKGDGRIVNRSMTVGEIRFLRGLNQTDPKLASRVADVLCNDLPDIPAEPIFPALAVQKSMLDAQADAIAEVNAAIPESERYATDFRLETARDEALRFSPAQIDAIARAIGDHSADRSAELVRLKAQRLLRKARKLVANGQAKDARAALAKLGKLTAGLGQVAEWEPLKAQVAALQGDIDRLG